jgi:protein RecA
VAKKKSVEEVSLDHLGGFFRVGAETRTPGNIPTGHFLLDFILHHGISPETVDLSKVEGYSPSEQLGLPLGKLVEIFGEEGAGKSSLAYRVCGYAQNMGYETCWIDVENSWSDDLAIINGVNRDTMWFSDLVNDQDPDTIYAAEDVFDNIINIIKTGVSNEEKTGKKLGVIVLDSVASLMSKAQRDKDAGESTVAEVARLMSNNLKKIMNYAAKYGVLVIFINQIREKIGVMFGNPETTPGGRALRYHSSIRLRVGRASKSGEITVKESDGSETLLGAKAKVRIIKNRFAKPYRDTLEIPIYYEPYFPTLDEMVFDVARQLKIIKPYLKEYRWKDEGINVKGRAEFIKNLKFTGTSNKLLAQVSIAAGNQGVILPPELAIAIEEKSEDLEQYFSTGSDEVTDKKDSSGLEKQTKRSGEKKTSPKSE